MIDKISWINRSMEIRSLLNPAFCCLLEYHFSKEFLSKGPEYVPYPLFFIVIPMLLNTEIRSKIPKRSTGFISNWLIENDDIRLNLHKRIIDLKPFVKEGILFGIKYKYFNLRSDIYGVVVSDKKIKKISGLPNEIQEIVKASQVLGRMFGSFNDTATIFNILGVSL